MTYIENVFLCLAIPLILSLFFTEGRGYLVKRLVNLIIQPIVRLS